MKKTFTISSVFPPRVLGGFFRQTTLLAPHPGRGQHCDGLALSFRRSLMNTARAEIVKEKRKVH
jgi:hypothetical protein